jgi:N-ethylmaleimide reductase
MSANEELLLLQGTTVGQVALKNRVVMAPMTRDRAGEGLAPTDLTVRYYEQRAGAGLIVTEGSQISEEGIGYILTPGIHTDAQVAGWKKVTDAVHAKGGKIFVQLWHVGRSSHPSLQPGGALPVAPSPIAIEGKTFTYQGLQDFVAPRALETEEIARVVADFAHAAKRAKEAGFDGVELHGANGYLIDQFLRDGSNQRTDRYGGSVENRVRFLLEVTEAVVGVWGPGRVGVRVSPASPFNSMHDSDPVATFGHAAEALNRFDLAYLHVVEPIPAGGETDAATAAGRVTPHLRRAFRGTLILNGGYDRDTAEAALQAGEGDLVSFGVPALANPDLVERMRQGAPLNEPDRSTFYGGTEVGYTDYPTLAELRGEHDEALAGVA